jgi:hypothetical protein
MNKPNFSPFRLILRMMTPVVFSDFAPTLDGLLFEALSKRFPEKTDQELREELKQYLAFNEDLGVFHASSAMIGIDNEHGLVAKEYMRVDVLQNKLSDEMFSPKKRGGKYSKIVVAGGPTKKRLTSRPAYAAAYIAFDGLGDVSPIKALLETYVIGIGYDAQNINSGAFSECIEIVLESDLSLFSEQKASRPLPAESEASGMTAMVRLLPPYYYGNLHKGVSPARIRVYHIDSLLKGTKS